MYKGGGYKPVRHHLRVLAVALSLAALLGCSGGNARPTPPTGPSNVPNNPPPPPSDAWTVRGSVTTTLSGVPVSGAEVATATGDRITATTDVQGRFELKGTAHPGATPFRLTITSLDHITRDVWIEWQPSRDVSIDMISRKAPFSLSFYRAFARGNLESPDDMVSLRRWESAPSFYVRTVDETGRTIESSVVNLIVSSIRKAVRDFSGGRYQATVETGKAARSRRTGWVNVNIVRETDEGDNVCGFAFVGANPGSITLVYDQCSCGSTKISGAVVMHEVGHAMGFFHVGDAKSLMYPFVPSRCPPGALSATELHHARVVYTRPRGNIDPDRDPSSAAFVLPPGGDDIKIIN